MNKNFSILGGDTNIVLLKSNLPHTQNYLDLMLSFNFIPNITIPTRFSNKSMTLIDHIMTRLPKSKIDSTIIAGNLICDISDHLPNFSIININLPRTNERPLIRVFSKKNKKTFHSNIKSEISKITNNLNLSNDLDVNDNYNFFNENLSNQLETNFPKVRLSRKKAKDKDWITPGIKNSIKHRNYLFQYQLKNNTPENAKKWRTYRNKLNKVIRDT